MKSEVNYRALSSSICSKRTRSLSRSFPPAAHMVWSISGTLHLPFFLRSHKRRRRASIILNLLSASSAPWSMSGSSSSGSALEKAAGEGLLYLSICELFHKTRGDRQQSCKSYIWAKVLEWAQVSLGNTKTHGPGKAWLWPEMPMRELSWLWNQVTVVATSTVESPSWQPSTRPQDPCLWGSPRHRACMWKTQVDMLETQVLYTSSSLRFSLSPRHIMPQKGHSWGSGVFFGAALLFTDVKRVAWSFHIAFDMKHLDGMICMYYNLYLVVLESNFQIKGPNVQ